MSKFIIIKKGKQL